MRYTMLPQEDAQAFAILQGEAQRQQDGLELIPSENYVSEAVLEALGCVLTNKYAEGTPGRRYYGGQTYTDATERLAIQRACALFGSDHANVQPLSGAAANLCLYHSWLDLGDTVLAMDLSHGGHLTHGAPVTFSAQAYRFVHYKMKDVETGELDYELLAALAKQHRPRMIVAGFSSYPRTPDYARIAEIARSVGALAMADMAHVAGLIAAELLPNPLALGFHAMTTTTHKSLRGPRGAMILSMGRTGNPLRRPPRSLEHLPVLIDRAVFPGLQGGPHMHQVLAIAVALGEAQRPAFREYGQQLLRNARALAEALLERGCTLITGGTENHLLVVDTVRSFGCNGQQAQQRLEQIGITANKNATPDDPLPPFQCSGLRLGSPCATSRGMREAEMEQIAEWIVRCLGKPEHVASLGEEVRAMCTRFPVPGTRIEIA